MANLAHTKLYNKPEKWLKPWHMGTYLRVLKEMFLMTQNMNPSNAAATFIQNTRVQKFWKPSKPCHVGIHWIALAEYSQMSAHGPGLSVS